MNVGRFNERNKRTVESYQDEIAHLADAIRGAEALLALKQSPNWAELERELLAKVVQLYESNRTLNPLESSDQAIILRNNGIIEGIELFINLPDERSRMLGGLKHQAVKTMREFEQDYPTNK